MTVFYNKPAKAGAQAAFGADRYITESERETLKPVQKQRSSMPNRILLVYQLERIIRELRLSDSSGQLLIGLSNFKAVMKHMVVRQCYYNDDREKMFWFEAMLTLNQNALEELGKSIKYHYNSTLESCKILFRVRTVVGDHMKNDKLSFKEILDMHPDYKAMIDSGDFKHAHLVRIVQNMYHKFRSNCNNDAILTRSEEENSLTYYMHLGQLKKTQKSISKIYGLENRLFNNDFPILLYRAPLTTRPLQLVAIFLVDAGTVQFMVYEKDSSEITTVTRSVESFADSFPFFNSMLSRGRRSEVGKRLLLMMKNFLILELYTRNLMRSKQIPVMRGTLNSSLPVLDLTLQ